MVLFDEIIEKEPEKKYICDHCKENFPAKEIQLRDPIDNCRILTPMRPFIYVDKEGKIMGGNEQPSKEKGDQMLACPSCDTIHLYGFDPV